MLEIITDNRVISFDGRILEILETNGESKRYHIAQIQSVEAKDHRGHTRMRLNYTKHNRPVDLQLQPEYNQQMEELIQAIQAAK